VKESETEKPAPHGEQGTTTELPSDSDRDDAISDADIAVIRRLREIANSIAGVNLSQDRDLKPLQIPLAAGTKLLQPDDLAQQAKSCSAPISGASASPGRHMPGVDASNSKPGHFAIWRKRTHS
jgi:hypothetical protein